MLASKLVYLIGKRKKPLLLGKKYENRHVTTTTDLFNNGKCFNIAKPKNRQPKAFHKRVVSINKHFDDRVNKTNKTAFKEPPFTSYIDNTASISIQIISIHFDSERHSNKITLVYSLTHNGNLFGDSTCYISCQNENILSLSSFKLEGCDKEKGKYL